MNTASNESKRAEMQDTGYAAAKRTGRSTVIAVVVCLLLAVAVWLLSMGAMQTNSFCLEIKGAPDAYSCLLSDTMLEVQGTVLDLKGMERIEVIFPSWIDHPGVYTLGEGDIILPEGVTLIGELQLTLTVTAK